MHIKYVCVYIYIPAISNIPTIWLIVAVIVA